MTDAVRKYIYSSLSNKIENKNIRVSIYQNCSKIISQKLQELMREKWFLYKIAPFLELNLITCSRQFRCLWHFDMHLFDKDLTPWTISTCKRCNCGIECMVQNHEHGDYFNIYNGINASNIQVSYVWFIYGWVICRECFEIERFKPIPIWDIWKYNQYDYDL